MPEEVRTNLIAVTRMVSMRCAPITCCLASQDRQVANEDIVVWHSFGLTHIPRSVSSVPSVLSSLLSSRDA